MEPETADPEAARQNGQVMLAHQSTSKFFGDPNDSHQFVFLGICEIAFGVGLDNVKPVPLNAVKPELIDAVTPMSMSVFAFEVQILKLKIR